MRTQRPGGRFLHLSQPELTRDPVPHPVAATDLRVAVLGTVMSNTGDAAILYGTVDALRRAYTPQLDVTIFDTLPEVCARHYPSFRVFPWLHRIIDRGSRRGWRRKRTMALALLAAKLWGTRPGSIIQHFLPEDLRTALHCIAQADLVMAPGGTYLVSYYRQYDRLFGFVLAICLGKPVIFFTQSIGPLPEGRDRRLMRLILSRASLVLLRDERSERALRDLGVVHRRVRVTADAAFALALDDLEHQPARKGSTHPRIAISVREWRHFPASTAHEGMDRYLSVIRGLCRALIDRHNAKLTFLSTCQGVPEYGYDDSKVADRVVSGLPTDVSHQIHIDRDFHSPKQLLDMFQSFDLLISTRMHAAILALSARTPSIAIAYEFKSSELFARLGIPERAFNIEDITADGLCAAVTEILGDPCQTTDDLWLRVARERDLARDAGVLIREFVVPRQ